ncbi:MAG TPA: type 2 lanthipeptide synthetase LanM family protein [Mycobacterium sp.]
MNQLRPSGEERMEAFYERVTARALTIDELFSEGCDDERSRDGRVPELPDQASDSELSARRLAAWCAACAGGDWSLFARRLERDGLSIDAVRRRFAAVPHHPVTATPRWVDDARWVGAAVHRPAGSVADGKPVAFEQLLTPVVQEAERLLWSDVSPGAAGNVSGGARACLRRTLLVELSSLTAAALYARFSEARERTGLGYDRYVEEMKGSGFERLFDDKPVLLRLMASLTRQWIETSRELVTRLDADVASIRRDLLSTVTAGQATTIEGDLSDPHNFGRSVRIIGFDDGSRVVYKPKDLRVDAAWCALVERLNRSAPQQLRAAHVVACDGYGWAEFIEHSSCEEPQDIPLFFSRAGGLLALLHCLAAVDMHQENIIACGGFPVPVDLEMLLQSPQFAHQQGGAYEAAMQVVVDSALTVGLLPAYGRDSANKIFTIAGVTSNPAPRMKLAWLDVNSDAMRPVKTPDGTPAMSNLPHIHGRYGRLGDHVEDFMSGFRDYALFLRQYRPEDLFAEFADLPIRTVLRPTRYYYMLLQRLRDHRSMDDGIVWSAQADFGARLADWDKDADPQWPLLRDERRALVDLNVPYFCASRDGLERAYQRVRSLDDREIGWQSEVIAQSVGALNGVAPRELLPADLTAAPNLDDFVDEADAVARILAQHAIRKKASAAWLGLDWLGDSEMSQLVVLGPDLYNGACGIALFLCAHAAVTHTTSSVELALAAVAPLRKTLRGNNSARTARSLGVGGGLGLGSIVYSLAVISALTGDGDVLADAHAAAELITDEVIAADRQLDVLGGSAGAVLGLLRLYRQTGCPDALDRATACGRHLLAQPRVGPCGSRMWASAAFGRPLNGMAHGAAGFAYALASLACVTGCDEFAGAAAECLAFEAQTFDAESRDWADLRGVDATSPPCKWCYGAPGIGLSRIAINKLTARYGEQCQTDIFRALDGVQRAWPSRTDTLCCGTLGHIEFLCDAGAMLHRDDLGELALARLHQVIETARSTADYRWSTGTGRFNLGLFRGIAGVGYTALRRVDSSLPDILIWE